jgi:hypothetical protein
LSRPDPVAGFFGGLLIVAGAVIAVLSGLCTLGFLGVMTFDALQRRGGGMLGGFGELLGLAAVFGGVPLAVGVGLVALGRTIRKPRR